MTGLLPSYHCLSISILAVVTLIGVVAADEPLRSQEVDRLLAAADESLEELNGQRAELSDAESHLAEIRRDAFYADQAALLSGREAEQTAANIAKKKVELDEAATRLGTTGKLLEQNREASIQAARDVAAAEQLLRNARGNAARAEQAVAQIQAVADSIRESIVILAQAAALTGEPVSAQTAELQASLDGLGAIPGRAKSVADETVVAVTQAELKQKAAVEARTDADATRRKSEQEHAAASRAHFARQREITGLRTAERRLRDRQKEILADREEHNRRIADVLERVKQLEADVARLHGAWVDNQERAEQALAGLQRFVSFSREVAPIFARRCASCHNNRSAGGRLNMNSYAALLKGGESGELLIPHDAEDSLLVMMVEDGSMPQDADPLTAEEIGVIRKWIDVGAPLDARASATAALFDIMPELPQPLPPDLYRVAVPVLATAFSPDGEMLATSGYHEVLLWDVEGRLLRRVTNVAQQVHDIEFTADGEMIAVAAGTPAQYGEVKLFRVADGSHVATLVRTTDSMYAVSISPDGRLLAAAGADRVVRILSLESHAVERTMAEHSDAVMDVSWAADSRRIVTAGQDRICKVFDAVTGESLQTFAGHEEPVFAAAFLPDGRRVISGGADRKLRVWQVDDKKQVASIDGFGDTVFRILVTPDGVLSAGADGKIRLHDLAERMLQQTWTGHRGSVYGLAQHADSKTIVTGGYDGEVRLWKFADGVLKHSFVASPGREPKVDVSER